VLLVVDIVAGYISPDCGRVSEAASRPLRLILRLLLPFGRGLSKYVLKFCWLSFNACEAGCGCGDRSGVWSWHESLGIAVMIDLDIRRAS